MTHKASPRRKSGSSAKVLDSGSPHGRRPGPPDVWRASFRHNDRRGVIERYRSYLPVSRKTPVITLLEGDTPLIPARYLADLLGINVKIYFKFEGLNPTGSFKDRGMTMAVSKAVERGAKAILCASTGNTSASAAAYAARAGLTCAVIIPQGKIALG